MLRSSLGFHTMALYSFLIGDEINQLIGDFIDYNERTGLILMYRKNEHGEYIKYFPKKDRSYLPLDIRIYFKGKDRGIKWHIHSNNWTEYNVEAIINPKILGGINDYLTAATCSDMNIAMINFNLESEKISPVLKTFADYSIKRIDYCANICLDDFVPECNSERIMNLIKRGDIPPHYEEWMKYDEKAHRMKSRPGSFYLINNSVVINCYSKYMQLLDRSRKNVENGFPPIPQTTLDAARSIIRFEVQCKYHKTYALSKEAEKSGNHNYNKYKSLFSPVKCVEAVSDYYKKVVGRGDWYTLQEAFQIIKSEHFNSQKEKRLLDALFLVSQNRSLAKAKASLQGCELETFKRTVKELSSLGINPVTIPKEWGIKHIPNLLQAYFKEVVEESNVWEKDFCTLRGYNEYCRIYGHSPI